MSYYNTTSLTGEALKEKETKSESLKERIRKMFIACPKMGPSDVYRKLYKAGQFKPITSIRRAITDLTNEDGFLVKTDERQPGLYSDGEHIWRVV